MSVKVVPPVWRVGPRGREMTMERQVSFRDNLYVLTPHMQYP